MAKWLRGKKNQGALVVNRRKRALALLEEDMKSGKIRTGDLTETHRPMEEKDRTRILKEMEILKNKT